MARVGDSRVCAYLMYFPIKYEGYSLCFNIERPCPLMCNISPNIFALLQGLERGVGGMLIIKAKGLGVLKRLGKCDCAPTSFAEALDRQARI